MGERGPAPRRDAERRRRNEPEHPIIKLSPQQLAELPFEIDLTPAPPEVPDDEPEGNTTGWHPIVHQFYEGLQRDPARKWMTSADWSAVVIFCETMSREMRPQVAGVTKEGEVVMAAIPPKSGTLATFLKLLDHIGVTEAARLRIQKEVTLFPPAPSQTDGKVTDIREGRKGSVQ